MKSRIIGIIFKDLLNSEGYLSFKIRRNLYFFIKMWKWVVLGLVRLVKIDLFLKGKVILSFISGRSLHLLVLLILLVL